MKLIEFSELQEVTEEVWSSMTKLSVRPSLKLVSSCDPRVVSMVEIAGTTPVSVRLEMDEALARQAAASLLAVVPECLTTQDILDAVGELTNMTGGGVKALLPPPNHLSIPKAAEKSQAVQTADPDSNKVQMVFDSEFGSLIVSIDRVRSGVV